MSLKRRTTPPLQRENVKYVFCLYVAGPHSQSLQAVRNIKLILEDFPDRYQLNIIDIYEHPVLASQNQIVAAPTLVKQLPLPMKKFVGDLSDKQKFLQGLK